MVESIFLWIIQALGLLLTGIFTVIVAAITGLANAGRQPIEKQLVKNKAVPSFGTQAVAIPCPDCTAANESGSVFCLSCGRFLVDVKAVKPSSEIHPLIIAFVVWGAFMLLAVLLMVNNGPYWFPGALLFLFSLGIGGTLLFRARA